MLVLTRKLGEAVEIGDDIRITVTDLVNKGVKLGIEAPKSVKIVRAELQQKKKEVKDEDTPVHQP